MDWIVLVELVIIIVLFGIIIRYIITTERLEAKWRSYMELYDEAKSKYDEERLWGSRASNEVERLNGEVERLNGEIEVLCSRIPTRDSKGRFCKR